LEEAFGLGFNSFAKGIIGLPLLEGWTYWSQFFEWSSHFLIF